jgi:hypothetical protein
MKLTVKIEANFDSPKREKAAINALKIMLGNWSKLFGGVNNQYRVKLKLEKEVNKK